MIVAGLFSITKPWKLLKLLFEKGTQLVIGTYNKKVVGHSGKHQQPFEFICTFHHEAWVRIPSTPKTLFDLVNTFALFFIDYAKSSGHEQTVWNQTLPWTARLFIYLFIYIHCRGKYHWVAGLPFEWFGFSSFSAYKNMFSFLVKSNPAGDWRPLAQWSFPQQWVF